MSGLFLSWLTLVQRTFSTCRIFGASASGLTYEQIVRELIREDGTTTGHNTITDWMNFFRDVCCEYFISHSVHQKLAVCQKSNFIEKKFLQKFDLDFGLKSTQN